jgi:hypothetical protein
MLGSENDFSDLLIFKRRNKPTEEFQKNQAQKNEATQKQQNYGTKAPASWQAAKVGLQSKENSQKENNPAASKPQQRKQPEVESNAANMQPKDVKGAFCINHPWREAYAYCAKCGLPYCFVEIMKYDGKMYCLDDIDSVQKAAGENENTVQRNSFSMLASVLLFANIAAIAYYTWKSTALLISLILSQGVLNFFVHLNQLYLFPIANVSVEVFGVIAAFVVLGRRFSAFTFSFIVTFVSVFIMVYQYLSNSETYALISSIILMIALSAMVYSRMTSETSKSESFASAPEVEWPKPEVF